VQVLLHLGQIEHLLGRDEVANGLQRRAVDLARRANDRRGLSQSLNNLGASLIYRGHMREARRVHEANRFSWAPIAEVAAVFEMPQAT